MIRSMTAFARASATDEAGQVVWELRSVNHRFLEPYLRLPEEFRGLDADIRERLAARLGRGKIDCTLRVLPGTGRSAALRVNHRLLDQLLAASEEIATRIREPATPHVVDLLRWPGLLEEPEQDPAELTESALTILDRALDALVANREREGTRLQALLLERCDKLVALVEQVRQRRPAVIAGAQNRIRDRLAEVAGELDPDRVEQEIVLAVQRLDVDEEMDRLTVHLEEVRKALSADKPVGRRLDFLMQELNREANTLSSKSADAETTHVAVDMKVLIEQMREQVQNLE
jgi:uncharacterized protein (TIGR00255 family)